MFASSREVEMVRLVMDHRDSKTVDRHLGDGVYFLPFQVLNPYG
jgi:hypothetical protein